MLGSHVRVEMTREVRNGDRDQLGRGVYCDTESVEVARGVGRASAVGYLNSSRIMGGLDSQAVEATHGRGKQ
jgi:hypothetical protein